MVLQPLLTRWTHRHLNQLPGQRNQDGKLLHHRRIKLSSYFVRPCKYNTTIVGKGSFSATSAPPVIIVALLDARMVNALLTMGPSLRSVTRAFRGTLAELDERNNFKQ